MVAAVGRCVSEARDEMLAREEGLLGFSRVGLAVGWEKPKERRLEGRLVGSMAGDWRESEAFEPPVRRLELRTVTVAGI